MMTPKKKYAKPTLKVAKWELNEAICNSVTCGSENQCFIINKGDENHDVERRTDVGSWDKVGSSSSRGW